LSREWLTRAGAVVPSVIVLSHEEQVERLQVACPEAVDRVLVAGDPCLDQLAASGMLRASYRRALGLVPGQRLVVVSSTWGSESLFGAWPGLVSELAEQLPVDEFRIAVALHPNIWFHHSRWQINQWTAEYQRAGVAVLSGMDDWRTAVVSADLVVGDHGSVSFYSAALGHPLLLAAAPELAVAPDSPIAALLAAAPRLVRGRDLHRQVRATIADHDAGAYAGITALATSVPGEAASLLRTALYRLLRLPEPGWPAEVDVLPLPEYRLPGAGALLVEAARTGLHEVRLTRFPAQRLHRGPAPHRGGHLVASVADARRRWLELADIVVGEAGANTAEWIRDTLTQFPGCVLVTAPDTGSEFGWLLGDRAGTLLRVAGAGGLFASAALQAMVDGRALRDLTGRWTLTAGAHHEEVVVELLSSGG
jgi:hypothetical protein